jgi:hypothetical protein
MSNLSLYQNLSEMAGTKLKKKQFIAFEIAEGNMRRSEILKAAVSS